MADPRMLISLARQFGLPAVEVTWQNLFIKSKFELFQLISDKFRINFWAYLKDRNCEGPHKIKMKLFSVSTNSQRLSTRVDLRHAIEKEVLTYLTAIQYDRKKDKLIEERNTTFTPLPKTENVPKSDPASKSCFSAVDYDPEDPMPQSGHYYIPDDPKSE